jgi:hypothetical protein
MIININSFNIARLHLTINENDTYVHYYCPRLTECLGKCDRRWIDSCTANSDISSLEKKKWRKKKATLSEQFPNIIEQFVASTHNDDPVYVPSLVQTRQYKTVGY